MGNQNELALFEFVFLSLGFLSFEIVSANLIKIRRASDFGFILMKDCPRPFKGAS